MLMGALLGCVSGTSSTNDETNITMTFPHELAGRMPNHEMYGGSTPKGAARTS